MKNLIRLLFLSSYATIGAAASAAEYQSAVARYTVETVVEGLEQPSGMVFLPDGKALVCERRKATLYRLDPKVRTLTPVQGLPKILAMEDSGLHDVTLHPDYRSSGWIYISYSEGEPHYSTLVVDRARLNGDRLTDRERVVTADAYTEDRFHYGGRMVFHGGFLYITVGDRHHQDRAQDLDNHAGKILRVHDDGRIPIDNPFVADHAKHGATWSHGHRNPQGLVVEPTTGKLWANEHGPRGGDELNLIERGANYGWPVVSWGFEYDGGPIGKGIVTEEGMQPPIWVWSKTIAPSDICFIPAKPSPHGKTVSSWAPWAARTSTGS